MGHKTYSTIIGAVLLEGDKVARAGWGSTLGYPSVDDNDDDDDDAAKYLRESRLPTGT